MVNLRKFLCITLASAALGATGAAQAAQPESYPSRPITVIVPFGAGGTADVVARVLAEKAGVQLGQPIVIDNRSGADGTIGAQAAARAKPDGSALLQLSTGHVILPSLRTDLPY